MVIINLYLGVSLLNVVAVHPFQSGGMQLKRTDVLRTLRSHGAWKVRSTCTRLRCPMLTRYFAGTRRVLIEHFSYDFIACPHLWTTLSTGHAVEHGKSADGGITATSFIIYVYSFAVILAFVFFCHRLASAVCSVSLLTTIAVIDTTQWSVCTTWSRIFNDGASRWTNLYQVVV